MNYGNTAFRRLLTVVTTSVSLGACCVLLASTGAAQDRLEYNRDIRPILANHCFACHGPDSASRKADLRLDQRDAAIEREAILPGEPAESEVIHRILSSEPSELMPPPETKKNLTAAEQQLLARWIQEGAEYQLHWSLIVPQRPAVPSVAELDEGRFQGWPHNPLDNFTLARMLAEGLEPAPEADRRALARRVSLDLTGLPPQPEVVEAFIADKSPRAYERFVDGLLASKHWGEHRGRYWLDYARYADTHGLHFDNYREMWSYRDWVFDAFNRNMPFDQFTIENLAGDLLPNRTLAQQVGSGFNRCNMTTNEGGIIDEEYLVLYTRDRTETTSQVWLGLTAGCAVCHNHKFDPLSQREFYEMAAFFNNTTQGARDGNIKNTPPTVAVPKQEDRKRWEELPGLLAQVRQQGQARREHARAEFDQWLASVTSEALIASLPQEKLYLHAPLNEGEGRTTQIHVDGAARPVSLAESASWQADSASVALQTEGAACELADVGDFDKEQPFTCAVWIKLTASDGYGAICARMDNANKYRGWDLWTQRRQIGLHLIDAWPDKALKVVGRRQVPAHEWVHVAVSHDGSGKAAGIKVYYNGQAQPTNVENDRLQGSINTEVPFKIGQRSTGEPLSQAALRDLRIYRRALSGSEIESLAKLGRFSAVLAKHVEQRTETETNELYDYWLSAFDGSFRQLQRQREQLEQERKAIEARGTIAHVMQEKTDSASAYILFRGEYDKRRDQVAPDTPDVLPAFPSDLPRNRLGFAKWLLLPEHPLTARVTVNRFWQEVFGTGMVSTSGDFGVSGALPSHPELLDWLAVEFRESGWDVKRLLKLMVMSATYRQSAVATPAKLQRDPANRLLSRGPRFRMDAEMVRDHALAVSGLLVSRIGGPSVKPYQPPGVWEAIAMNVSNTRRYERGSGDDLYRRSVYTFVKRMAPPASMETFNAPNREYCVVRRERTNTPLQAFVTLNDEQFVEAARKLAQRALLEGGGTIDGRLKVLGLRLLARDFRREEKAIIHRSLAELLTFYVEHPTQAERLIHFGETEPDTSLNPVVLAAWTMLANQLMNLDEVLNK